MFEDDAEDVVWSAGSDSGTGCKVGVLMLLLLICPPDGDAVLGVVVVADATERTPGTPELDISQSRRARTVTNVTALSLLSHSQSLRHSLGPRA